VRRHLSDRRVRPRFDIVGDMWGTLETVLTHALRNVGRGGILIESPQPLPLQSVHRLMFRAGEEDIAIDVRVQHVRPDPEAAAGEPRFLVGLQFVTEHPALMERIDQWLYADEGESDAIVGV